LACSAGSLTLTCPALSASFALLLKSCFQAAANRKSVLLTWTLQKFEKASQRLCNSGDAADQNLLLQLPDADISCYKVK